MSGAPRGPLWRAFARVVALPPASRFFMWLATGIDRPLLRASRGRVRLSFVIPTLLLTCRGARTGRPREVPLLYVRDGAALVVVGSHGGKPSDPAWCHNLRAEPRVTCTLGGTTAPYVAHELAGAGRERAWRLAVAVYPGYGRYEARLQRTIPVFRLEPVASDVS